MTAFALIVLGIAALAIIGMAWRAQRRDRKAAAKLARMNVDTDDPEISDRWLDERFRKKEGE